MATLNAPNIWFDLNDSDDDESDDDDVEDQPVLEPPPEQAANAVDDPQRLPPKKRVKKTEWDKLTTSYLNNGTHLVNAYDNTRRGGCVTKTIRKKSSTPRSCRSCRKQPCLKRSTCFKSNKASSTPMPEPTITCNPSVYAWKPGDRCEAKHQAQLYASWQTRWYAGTVMAVSDDGLRCDVRYRDGDFEAGVLEEHMRLPKAARQKLPKLYKILKETTAEAKPPKPVVVSKREANVVVPVMPEVPAEKKVESVVEPLPESPRPTVSPVIVETTAGSQTTAPETPVKDLRSKMIHLLLRDLSPFGLSVDECAALVDAVKGNRERFRRMRYNLKHNATVTLALVQGEMALERIADLSAFTQAESRSEPKKVAREESAHLYTYRDGQYLPRSEAERTGVAEI